jgi:hypothetical protein
MRRNDSRLRLALLIVVVAASMVCLLACSSSGNRSRADSDTRHTFKGETDTRYITLEVKSNMISNDLEMAVEVQAGTMSWVLKDPNGTVQWRETLEAPASRDWSRDLEAIAGQWELELSLEAATGEYEVHWSASS